MDDGAEDQRPPLPTVERTLQLILGRLDSFPAERLARIETQFQQLKSLLEEESQSRRSLDQELRRLAKEFQEMLDTRIDRAFCDCRRDRDLRLGHLSERVDSIQIQRSEERSLNVRMKVALFGAITAFAVSIMNAVINIVFHK